MTVASCLLAAALAAGCAASGPDPVDAGSPDRAESSSASAASACKKATESVMREASPEFRASYKSTAGILRSWKRRQGPGAPAFVQHRPDDAVIYVCYVDFHPGYFYCGQRPPGDPGCNRAVILADDNGETAIWFIGYHDTPGHQDIEIEKPPDSPH